MSDKAMYQPLLTPSERTSKVTHKRVAPFHKPNLVAHTPNLVLSLITSVLPLDYSLELFSISIPNFCL